MAKIRKIPSSTGSYQPIYEVKLTTKFFFLKDGTFDGIEVDVEGRPKEEQKLVLELCRKLAEARALG